MTVRRTSGNRGRGWGRAGGEAGLAGKGLGRRGRAVEGPLLSFLCSLEGRSPQPGFVFTPLRV
jgi:hypothetical protein